MEKNKDTKMFINIANFIGYILLSCAIILYISSIFWILSGDTTDKWFSRYSMSLISLGFAGIIYRLRK